MDNLFHSFVISSSIVCFIITALYVSFGISQNKQIIGQIPYVEWFIILIPLMYGIFGQINYVLLKYNSYSPLLVGAVLGFVLSYFGRYYLNLPKLIFGHTDNDEYLVHIYAVPLYALIFMFIITPLQKHLIN